MSISLTEDFKTAAELKSHSLEILQQIQSTGRPVVVTMEGKPAVVMIDAATYERKLKAVNLARLIAEAEGDVRAGEPLVADTDHAYTIEQMAQAFRAVGRPITEDDVELSVDPDDYPLF